MANLYIEEYETIVIDPATGTLVPMVDRFVTAQAIPLGATSSLSDPTFPQSRFVAITADADCRFAIGGLPDATASMRYLAAAQTRFFKVHGGERVSAIAAEKAA
jgi:hypothetical protein